MGISSMGTTYFKDPMVIIGLVLFVSFYIVKGLMKYGLIKSLPAPFETGALRFVKDYGFVIGLTVVFLGMGLKHNNIKAAEQTNALTLLKAEYQKNVGEAAATYKLYWEKLKSYKP